MLLLLAIVPLYTHLILIKMFARTGSPAFQFVKVTGRPVDIQKKLPSSPWSVPAVQKCSLPKPWNPKNVLKIFHRTEFYGHKWPLALNGTHTEFFYVFLQLVVFDLALDAGQLHSVVVTEFGRLVPIGLFVFPFRMAVKERRWKKVKVKKK